MSHHILLFQTPEIQQWVLRDVWLALAPEVRERLIKQLKEGV
jgi:hypothetical protein